MTLTAQQRNIATLLFRMGINHGLSPQHAREFAAAAYAESGLRPGAVNKQSGAAGLFQLLSGGYRQKAQSLGGLHNPRANALAILPDYVKYWQQHPNARPGEAGAAVERSGAGASFYARGLPLLQQLGGGGSAIPPLARTGSGARSSAPPAEAAPDRQSLLSLIQAIGQRQPAGNVIDLLQQIKASQAQNAPTSVAPLAPRTNGTVPSVGKSHARINELFFGNQAIKNGRPARPVPGHGDHDHVSMSTLQAQLAVENHARQMGMHVGEEQNSDVHPVHVKNSYHYRNYPGSKYRQAADISGSPAQMRALYQWVLARYGR